MARPAKIIHRTAQWFKTQFNQTKTRLKSTLQERVGKIEIPVGIIIDSTGGCSIGFASLSLLLFCQKLTDGGGKRNVVISRLDDFESPFADVRGKAFLELVLRGEEILDDLKSAILNFDISGDLYSIKFQYLSQLFSHLPIDPQIKLEILREPFELSKKGPFLWEPTRTRIYREFAFLAVKEGEKIETQNLFKKAILERRFDYDFHHAIINALLAMNNETTIELLLEILTLTDVSDYMVPLTNYALGRMISQNVTSEQKRILGIPQLGDIIPPEFLTTHPMPGEKPLDLRYSHHLDPFQERLIYESEQPKAELVKIAIEKIVGFVQEHSNDVSVCLTLLEILEENRIFSQSEIPNDLSKLANDPTINISVRSKAHFILRNI